MSKMCLHLVLAIAARHPIVLGIESSVATPIARRHCECSLINVCVIGRLRTKAGS